MEKKTGTIIIVLIVLLAVSLSYIGYIEFTRRQTQKQLSAFQQGAQAGYEQAILQITQQAATCQQVPLRIGNQTLNIIAVDCLQARE